MSKTDQVIEKIEDFFSIYRERVKSPFGGTFLICWLLSHWPLIYAVLAFDDGTLLHYKIIFIKSYLGLKGWWGMIWQPALLTLISFIVFTLINLVFIGLSSAVRYLVKPKVIEIASNKEGVVEKAVHLKALNLVKELRGNLQKERETSLEFTTRIKSVETELIEANQKVATADITRTTATLEKEEAWKERDEAKKKLEEAENFKSKWAEEIRNIETSRGNALKLEFLGKWVRVHGKKNVLGGTDTVYEVFYMNDAFNQYYIYTDKTKATALYRYSIEIRTYDVSARFIWFTLTPHTNTNQAVQVKLFKMADYHWEGYEIAQNGGSNPVIYFSLENSNLKAEHIHTILRNGKEALQKAAEGLPHDFNFY